MTKLPLYSTHFFAPFLRSEHKVKNSQLHQQLQTSTVNLPLVQIHHILSAIFATRANKFEFLTLAAYIVERLSLLMSESVPQKHPEVDDVSVNFKARFVESLGEIAKIAGEEKRRLEGADGEEGEGGRKEGGAGGVEEEEEEALREGGRGIGGRGAPSGRYFRKCSNVLRAQVEVWFTKNFFNVVEQKPILSINYRTSNKT